MNDTRTKNAGSFAHTTLRLAPLILEYTDLKSLLTLETTAVFRKEPFPFVQPATALDGLGHLYLNSPQSLESVRYSIVFTAVYWTLGESPSAT